MNDTDKEFITSTLLGAVILSGLSNIVWVIYGHKLIIYLEDVYLQDMLASDLVVVILLGWFIVLSHKVGQIAHNKIYAYIVR